MANNPFKKETYLVDPKGLKRKYNLKDYEDLVEKTNGDFELVDGELIPIELGSAKFDHGILTSSVVSILNRKLKKTNCVTIAESSEVLVKSPDGKDIIFRPDVVVLCGDIDLNSKRTETPTLIVEVLSPSTELVDRTRKLYSYLNISSLKGYLIVEKKEKRIELHRNLKGSFYFESFGSGQTIEIRDFVKLDVDEIYEDLERIIDLKDGSKDANRKA